MSVAIIVDCIVEEEVRIEGPVGPNSENFEVVKISQIILLTLCKAKEHTLAPIKYPPGNPATKNSLHL